MLDHYLVSSHPNAMPIPKKPLIHVVRTGLDTLVANTNTRELSSCLFDHLLFIKGLLVAVLCRARPIVRHMPRSLLHSLQSMWFDRPVLIHVFLEIQCKQDHEVDLASGLVSQDISKRV